MRVLLLISKIPFQCDNNSTYMVNADVIKDILHQNPQFLGALHTVFPKLNMYTINPPEMNKQEQNNLCSCFFRKHII